MVISAIALLVLSNAVTMQIYEASGAWVGGPVYIRADGSVDPPDAPIVTVDKVTYTLIGNITSSGDGIIVERDNIVIDGAGYTVQGAGAGNGIDLTSRYNVTIKNTNIKDFGRGIKLYNSQKNTISGNNMTNGFFGIRMEFSSSNTITGNTIANNVIFSIYMWYSPSNVISGNNITNNTYGVLLESSSGNTFFGNLFVNCGLLVFDSYGNVVVDNTVNGRPLIYLEGASDVAVKDAGQVILVNCNNITVQNLNLSNTTAGIELWNTHNSTINGNNITNNYFGVFLGFSSNNVISGNNIENNNYGIDMDYSNNNTVSGNNIANNYFGVSLGFSSNNVISGNTIANNGLGIYLAGSSGNTVSGNTIANNSYGVLLGFSSGNRFYHNNFVGNALQVYSYDSLVNVWDDGYPGGGNYWSDYAGVDYYSGPGQDEPGCDGIGDTPYVIDEVNVDRYPLMRPWGQPYRAYLVVRGADNSVYYRVYDSAEGWGGWMALPGSTPDAPAAAVCAGALHIVVRGMDGVSLYHGYVDLESGVFSGWSWISGSTPSPPTLASNGTHLALVVRGADNCIYYRVYSAAAQAWGGWMALPSGQTCDKPAAALVGATLKLVVRGFSGTMPVYNNTLWYGELSLDSGAFSGWTWMPGSVTSSPTLSPWGISLVLAVRGEDNCIYLNVHDGSGWLGWSPLPAGSTPESPAAAAVDSTLHLVVIGMDGATLWHSTLNLHSGEFTGWTWITGTTPSKPTLTK